MFFINESQMPVKNSQLVTSQYLEVLLLRFVNNEEIGAVSLLAIQIHMLV